MPRKNTNEAQRAQKRRNDRLRKQEKRAQSRAEGGLQPPPVIMDASLCGVLDSPTKGQDVSVDEKKRMVAMYYSFEELLEDASTAHATDGREHTAPLISDLVGRGSRVRRENCAEIQAIA